MRRRLERDEKRVGFLQEMWFQVMGYQRDSHRSTSVEQEGHQYLQRGGGADPLMQREVIQVEKMIVA